MNSISAIKKKFNPKKIETGNSIVEVRNIALGKYFINIKNINIDKNADINTKKLV